MQLKILLIHINKVIVHINQIIGNIPIRNGTYSYPNYKQLFIFRFNETEQLAFNALIELNS